MIDPKFANLPWIACDSSDVYETSDLPEADQNLKPQVDRSDFVEIITIKPDEAFKRFEGKTLSTEGVDFSDRIVPMKRLGYSSGKERFELVSVEERSKETPFEQFQRLQSEIFHLSRQLKETKAELKDGNDLMTQSDGSAAPLSVSQLSELTDALNEQLHELDLLTEMQSEKGLHLLGPSPIVHKKLLSYIDTYKNEKQRDKTKPAASASKETPEDPSKCVYHLYNHTDAQKSSFTARYGDLERRIARMEALLGENPTKVSILTADTMSHGLLEGVHKICARSSLLSSSHLDQVDAKISGLIAKLSTITDKKDVISRADTQNKVAELYALVKKWDSMAASMPDISERLTALQQLHEQATQFSQTLTLMDKSQQELEETMKTDSQVLQELKQTLSDAMDEIGKCSVQWEAQLQK